MEQSTPLATLGSVCHRYGPGRLPGANRADIGAGYAGASAALFAVLAWVISIAVLSAFGVVDGGAGLAVVGLYAIPFVVPAAFVAGVLVWRFLPKRTPHFGAVAGLLGTIGTYIGAVIVLAAVFSISLGEVTVPEIIQAGQVAAAYGLVGFLFTFWVALPVGCVSGVVYERVGTEAGVRNR